MNRNLFAITLACLSCMVLLPTVRAEENSSKKAESKPFAWWCQNYDSFPEETQTTIKAVLDSQLSSSLRNCQLADSKLRQSKELTIYNSAFMGSKKMDLKPISTLNHLTVLSIQAHGIIDDLSPLAGMTKLEKLDLSPGGKISDIRLLAPMKNMAILRLPGQGIVDIAPLSRMSKLWSLDLTGNRISDIKPLSRLRNLTNLELSYNQISDIRSLATLKKLTNLKLENNKFTEANCPLPLIGTINVCHF